jgi:two-component system phosphate regulon response regulator PhoB
MERKGPILVVEDEDDIRNLIVHQLQREGMATLAAATGLQAIEIARRTPPALIILDLMLPGLPGTEVCRRLRAEAETREVPIIILSARGEEIDRVVGFEVGADDYVTKPFSPRELVLRVRAVLRRGAPPPLDAASPAAGALEVGVLLVDEAAHRVFVKGEEAALTATEFKLLLTLMRRAGRVQSRAQLLQDVWDLPPDMYTRTVDTHMKRLREKLGAASGHIETVRGVGYRFSREPVEEE